MEETYNLELNFETETGSNKKITLRKPLIGLKEAEVLPVMQTIIDQDIFEGNDGDSYATPKNARYVRRSVEEIYEA